MYYAILHYLYKTRDAVLFVIFLPFVLAWMLLKLIIKIYMFPSLLTAHKAGEGFITNLVFWLNIFFGWTLIGYFTLLAVALALPMNRVL